MFIFLWILLVRINSDNGDLERFGVERVVDSDKMTFYSGRSQNVTYIFPFSPRTVVYIFDSENNTFLGKIDKFSDIFGVYSGNRILNFVIKTIDEGYEFYYYNNTEKCRLNIVSTSIKEDNILHDNDEPSNFSACICSYYIHEIQTNIEFSQSEPTEFTHFSEDFMRNQGKDDTQMEFTKFSFVSFTPKERASRLNISVSPKRSDDLKFIQKYNQTARYKASPHVQVFRRGSEIGLEFPKITNLTMLNIFHKYANALQMTDSKFISEMTGKFIEKSREKSEKSPTIGDVYNYARSLSFSDVKHEQKERMFAQLFVAIYNANKELKGELDVLASVRSLAQILIDESYRVITNPNDLEFVIPTELKLAEPLEPLSYKDDDGDIFRGIKKTRRNPEDEDEIFYAQNIDDNFLANDYELEKKKMNQSKAYRLRVRRREIEKAKLRAAKEAASKEEDFIEIDEDELRLDLPILKVKTLVFFSFYIVFLYYIGYYLYRKFFIKSRFLDDSNDREILIKNHTSVFL